MKLQKSNNNTSIIIKNQESIFEQTIRFSLSSMNDQGKQKTDPRLYLC